MPETYITERKKGRRGGREKGEKEERKKDFRA